MSHYTKICTKPLRLRKDTPTEVIDMLHQFINLQEYKHAGLKAPLFELKRWQNLFIPNYWYPEPIFSRSHVTGQWTLKIHTEVNYGYNEIAHFCYWISQYVTGHKPKEFIAWYKSEEDRRATNIYIYRKLNYDKMHVNVDIKPYYTPENYQKHPLDGFTLEFIKTLNFKP